MSQATSTLQLSLFVCTSMPGGRSVSSSIPYFTLLHNKLRRHESDPTPPFFVIPSGKRFGHGKILSQPHRAMHRRPALHIFFSCPNYVSFPISDLLQVNTKLHVLDTSFSLARPILPRTGDVNLDGFPDLLLITECRSSPSLRPMRVRCSGMRMGCARWSRPSSRWRESGRRWHARRDGAVDGLAGCRPGVVIPFITTRLS
ncbi:hypothetical protein BJV74DRAFT_136165 [Russula compacta]|nr:hypothetical protein BJV74DRAFT_136165 [Russula compacta]